MPSLALLVEHHCLNAKGWKLAVEALSLSGHELRVSSLEPCHVLNGTTVVKEPQDLTLCHIDVTVENEDPDCP